MINLQILGIGCRRSKALKDNVLEALKRYPLNVTLEEITEVDELMKFDISSTPALLINGKVVVENDVLSVEEIRELLERCGAREQNTLRLKNILVPTDFSESSKCAFIYAQALAAEVEASIKVVHMYQPEFDEGNPFVDEPLATFERSRRESLREFVEENAPLDGGHVLAAVRIDQEVVLGFPSEAIVELSRSGKFDLVVMGTTGEAGFLGRVLGQVSTQVSQQAKCPVLFVPRGVTHRSYRNVLFAAKYQPGEDAILRWITKWTVFFSANLHLVHVLDSRENGFNRETIEIERLFQRNGQRVEVASVKNESVVEGLNQYAREKKIDLVVLTALQRRFYERFFHRSVTKRLLINSKLPLLVVPTS
ncbi:MAG: universal stress protein [Saprospirales bacterium]|nr:universal stress protein [Saprospirales bacterium]MBK7337695.1 universal stress protein [Saprospirales bacterium]